MACPRVAYIHIGYPKTGTTSIQVLLGANETRFADAGLYLPSTARVDPSIAGHHNVAWELMGDPTFEQSRGTLVDLLAEIGRSRRRDVCLSSEEFARLGAKPAALRRLVDGLRALGYLPKIIVYVRPQADYYESLYVEILKHAYPLDFSFGLANLRLANPKFDYAASLEPFARAVGREHMIVRAFRREAPPIDLLRDFVSLVAPRWTDFPVHARVPPGKSNERLPFGDVYQLASTLLLRDVAQPDMPAAIGPFEPLSLLQILGIGRRYWFVNLALWWRYGAWLGWVSPQRLWREIRTVLHLDPGSAQRKRWFAALDRGCGCALMTHGVALDSCARRHGHASCPGTRQTLST